MERLPYCFVPLVQPINLDSVKRTHHVDPAVLDRDLRLTPKYIGEGGRPCTLVLGVQTLQLYHRCH